MRDRLKLNFPTLLVAALALSATGTVFAQASAPASAPAKSSIMFAPGGAAAGPRAHDHAVVQSGDYIVAVVNQESVTNNEVTQRINKVREDDAAAGGPQPTPAELRKQALDSLVEERVIVTYARDLGVRVDDSEVDRAIGNIASSNKLTIDQLRDRMRQQGLDYTTFRNGIRDQILTERIREREVVSHIRVTDAEIADYIAKLRGNKSDSPEIDIAQILLPVGDKATAEEADAQKSRAELALARVKNGEPFENVARDMSADTNKDKGGDMGSRPLDRYPDLVVQAVADVKVGGVSGIVRSGAGFHILKVISRGEQAGMTITQTRVRHIVLRPSSEMTLDQAQARIIEFRQMIASGARTFEDVARQYSEDGSSQQGGDLGWSSPGSFVPEFEAAMDKLPVGGLSGPVRSRFGVHLIQVIDRRETVIDPKQLREQATNALKEQKFEPAYKEWVADLRAKAFIEYRDPPV
jgi:peptidyl-prolyl cis-trans isomerase SurA